MEENIESIDINSIIDVLKTNPKEILSKEAEFVLGYCRLYEALQRQVDCSGIGSRLSTKTGTYKKLGEDNREIVYQKLGEGGCKIVYQKLGEDNFNRCSVFKILQKEEDIRNTAIYIKLGENEYRIIYQELGGSICELHYKKLGENDLETIIEGLFKAKNPKARRLLAEAAYVWVHSYPKCKLTERASETITKNFLTVKDGETREFLCKILHHKHTDLPRESVKEIAENLLYKVVDKNIRELFIDIVSKDSDRLGKGTIKRIEKKIIPKAGEEEQERLYDIIHSWHRKFVEEKQGFRDNYKIFLKRIGNFLKNKNPFKTVVQRSFHQKIGIQ